MKDNDIELLEKLLKELCSHLGHPFSVSCPVIHDGFSIGVFGIDGDLIKQESSYDLNSTIEKIKSNP